MCVQPDYYYITRVITKAINLDILKMTRFSCALRGLFEYLEREEHTLIVFRFSSAAAAASCTIVYSSSTQDGMAGGVAVEDQKGLLLQQSYLGGQPGTRRVV